LDECFKDLESIEDKTVKKIMESTWEKLDDQKDVICADEKKGE